jgi:hypothetical protein
MKGLGLSCDRGFIFGTSAETRKGSRGRWSGMTLNLFMAICVIGCDVLIYFLFQWTLGERGRTRRRRSNSRRRVENGTANELIVLRSEKRDKEKLAKVLAYARNELQKRTWTRPSPQQPEPINEEFAHRRRAVAFSSHKQDSKLISKIRMETGPGPKMNWNVRRVADTQSGVPVPRREARWW